MEWKLVPEQVLLNHYELKDGVPTNGELLLDARLDSIDNLCQRPLSDNLHSVFNKRHYITYGGYLQNKDLIKPPWVEVQQTEDKNHMDRCTLCKSKKGGKKGGLPWCNDGHFQSSQHRGNVIQWFDAFESRCQRSGAVVYPYESHGRTRTRMGNAWQPAPTAAPAPAAGASKPCAGVDRPFALGFAGLGGGPPVPLAPHTASLSASW